MKRALFLLVFLALFLLSPRLFLGALEIELTAGAGNMAFDPEKDESLFDEIKYQGHFNLKGGFFDIAEYNIRFERESFFHNTISANFSIDLDYIYLEFGQFVGIWDDFEFSPEKGFTGKAEMPPDVGISGGLRLSYPGIAFLAFKGSSTLNLQNEAMSGNFRETAEITLGGWLPYVIPSVSASIKTFTRQPKDTVTRNELTRLWTSADIFAKNIPLTVRADFGYEILTHSIKDENSVKLIDDHELRAIFLGFEAKWQLLKPLRLIGGMEVPVYVWIEKPKKESLVKDIFFYYQLYAGVAWTFLR